MKNLLQKALIAVGVLGVGYLIFKPGTSSGQPAVGPGAPAPSGGFKPSGPPNQAGPGWVAHVGDHLLLGLDPTLAQKLPPGTQDVYVRVVNVQNMPIPGMPPMAMVSIDDYRQPAASATGDQLPLLPQFVQGIWPA